ncbi:MAG TPA: tripartite tricarboxylate transporter substrate binding protein [Xanthobacteraceae bacterium]|jgi:tripartite-type tricarboxylate transporter receptor subunit TctC|nr:tripartite tricarboxylate transporter substrate binding protein [Xanthobacteraceae bacterium]
MTAKMERRRLIGALGAAALTPLAAPLARPARAAEAWPVRPVTVLCPFAAGTSADTLMRMINASLGKKFGQNFIVEDRPGATGNIAAGAAARATPDGYTLLIGTVGPIVNNKFLYKHLDFNPDRAFAPVAALAYSPLIFVGSPKLPVKTLQELVAYAKAKHGPLNAGTVGVGSQAHITIQLLNKLAGISIGHVSYRISSQALPDLASGDLQLSVQYIPTFVPQVQSGMVRGLAVTSLKRLPELPDVPTAAESGFPGFEASGWFALFAPAGTPPGIVSRINEGVNEFLQSDAGKKQLANIWMTPMGGSPAWLADYIRSENAKWGPIIKQAGISLQ